MTTKIPRPLTLQLDPDGTFRCRDRNSNREIAFTPAILALLSAIGRGEKPESWAELQGVEEQEATAAVQSLMALGVLVDDAAEAPAPVPARELPIFVVGCHRSGTTLLRWVLDAHPDIACPPESKFMLGLLAFLEYPQVLPALGGMGFGPDEVLGEIRGLTESILGGYAKRMNKRRWADKTPNYWRILDFIDDVFQRRVLYVFIVRHPLDCVESLYNFFGYGTTDPEVRDALSRHGNSRRGFGHYWSEANERIHLFATAHPERSHTVRYEDLLRGPEQVVRQTLEFLGEQTPPGLLEHAFTNSHDGGFMDAGIVDATGIDPTRVDRWKKWPPGEIEAVWRVVEPVARRLGYQAR